MRRIGASANLRETNDRLDRGTVPLMEAGGAGPCRPPRKRALPIMLSFELFSRMFLRMPETNSTRVPLWAVTY